MSSPTSRKIKPVKAVMLDSNNLIFNPGYFSPRVENVDNVVEHEESSATTVKHGRKIVPSSPVR